MSLAFDLFGDKPRRAPVVTEADDCSSRDGAQKLCDKINEYWRERGFDAGAFPVYTPFNVRMRGAYYYIKSNLIDGQPRALPSPEQDQ